MLKINKVKKSRLFIAGALVVCGAVGGLWSYHTLKKTDPAKATLAGFDASNLMSDEVMGNYNSMTEQQIWGFLHQHGSCDDRRTYLADKYKQYKYHIKDGHFVCMADETFDGETTSHIIWQAAQDYHINPQVLIVLLQKEQNLVLDSWPNDHQYRTATGFGCPDTAACDSQYFGFRNQVRQAANMFRDVLNGGWSNYPAYKTSFIHYHPNSSCGGQNIYIANRATSALYRYTPYIPNQAALNAGKGTGDSCSSYGNRNFYNYFTEWFGDSKQLAVSDVNIPSGVYNIYSSNEYLDVSGNRIWQNSSNVQLWSHTAAEGQKWQIDRLSNGLYSIRVAGTNKYLDVSGAGTSDGSNVQIYAGNGTCAQQWAIQKNGDGYRLVSACSGKSLDITGNRVANGTNIEIWTCHDGDAQRFQISRVMPNGVYKLTVGNNEYLDVSGNRIWDAGRNVQLWSSAYVQGQRWRVTQLANGNYSLRVDGTNSYLDVSSASINNGANVQIWPGNDTCAQQWKFTWRDNGLTLQSGCSDKVLDVSGNRIVNGRNVQIWQTTGAQGQHWNLIAQ